MQTQAPHSIQIALLLSILHSHAHISESSSCLSRSSLPSRIPLQSCCCISICLPWTCCDCTFPSRRLRMQGSCKIRAHGRSATRFNFWGAGARRYAAGATIQVVMFGILAIEIKRKAPTAHTVLEIINARWGRRAHLTFIVFCLMTNIIVCPLLSPRTHARRHKEARTHARTHAHARMPAPQAPAAASPCFQPSCAMACGLLL